MNACRICLRPLRGKTPVHAACARDLYGAPREPVLDIALSRLQTVALAMVGRASLSGVQRKLSLSIDGDRQTLQVATDRGCFILKPQAGTYQSLPENEHLSMRLAEASGLEIPPCGLITLADGSLAYIVRRFDRRADDTKRRQDDFCQLAGLPPRSRYDSSAERCARLVRQFASEPGIALLQLFRQLVFCWWNGNGDAHLKNFSLLSRDDGTWGMSPAYDQVATHLVIRDDDLALPVKGKKSRLRRTTWIAFASDVGLPKPAAAAVLDQQAAALERACELVHRSFLPDEMRLEHEEFLRQRTRELAP